jgi:hypothetical protein
MKEVEVDTYKELFNNSLTLFQWAIDEVKRGHVIASVDEEREKYRVLAMHVLGRVARKAKRQPVGVGADSGRETK